MITRQDIMIQVRDTLGVYGDDFDIDAIVDDIVTEYGLIDIDDIPSSEYLPIVERHDLSVV